MNGYDKMIQALIDGYVDLRDLCRISGARPWQVRRYLNDLRNAGHLMVSPRRYHLVDGMPVRWKEPLPQEPVIRIPAPGTIMERALLRKAQHGVEDAVEFLAACHISRELATIALVGGKRASEHYGVDVSTYLAGRQLRVVKVRAA